MITGITGGIGSGKSVVSRILRLNRFPVYDCDSQARMLMENDMQLVEAVKDILGECCYNSSGQLDRKITAALIFNDSGKRDSLNRVVHDAVFSDFIEWCKKYEDKTVFCESAILATSRLDKICNRIIIVTAPEATRIKRVAARNGLTVMDIRKRMKSQEHELQLLPAAKTVFIDNSGNKPLLPQILDLVHNGAVSDRTSYRFEINI